ncbi:quinone-dependent dihydroorotate dehydrogenase [Sulfurimonas sp. HSL-3221]|uniref:quinone-dependent dihydroorotate dehydrogenase n=1 Tax=Sulfurimonadaceae TaxID=2771471 RepID=UPI001E290CAA|nr:quinone-dependent dihydroorotate dehydrogenase [Sulfurimonas sp. HSL-3221]UFS63372.1 quinone-dependent dihydroorotate dehydrogenase [Sulfurimonas sp. HSL-3221]
MIAYESLKPWLFKLQPETAHHVVATLLRTANACPSLFNRWQEKHFVADPILNQELFGRTFPNPVGLGAGFDKNATMIRGIQALGFGYTEIGTVTPQPQPGNPKPRMFRHVDEETIQNAMGFNNDGMYKVQQRLKARYPFTTPIGVNIGKNKTTEEQNAISDYTQLIRGLHDLGDYLVINISSPNTPGLRDLQNETFIAELFAEAKTITDKPILLKIAPDITPEQAVALTTLAVEKGADGIIATNTTIDYSLVAQPKSIGGLSGKVLKEKSFAIFEAVAKELFGKTVLISVGGIDSAEEAYRRIKAGASLVQVYSALIFKGPELIGDINRGLADLLKRDGYSSITEAIGADRR